jgi:hypothetical protein
MKESSTGLMDTDQNKGQPEGQKDDRENPFISMIVNIVIPFFILTRFSDHESLGPIWSLIVALIFPFAYGSWDFIRRRKANFISIVGLISILATGGLGLLKADPFWFAVKEAAIPTIFGIYTLYTTRTEKPFVKMLLYNDKVIEVALVEMELANRNNQQEFHRLLMSTTWLLTLSFLVSAALNFVLAIIIVKSPGGTPEFNQELGTMTVLSWPVIVVPCMIILGYSLWRLISGIKKLTGLELEKIFKGR